MELFAHEVSDNQSFSENLSAFFQQPVVAVITVTLVVTALMLLALKLLKHHTTWRFPYNQGDK